MGRGEVMANEGGGGVGYSSSVLLLKPSLPSKLRLQVNLFERKANKQIAVRKKNGQLVW